MLKKFLDLIYLEFFKNFPKQFLFLFILLLMESLILASSVLAIVPLADYFINPELSNPSKITKELMKILSLFDIDKSYFTFASIFVILNITRSFFAIFIKYSILKIKYNIVKSITKNLLENIFLAKWSFFNNLGSGKVLNTLNKENVSAKCKNKL